MWSRLDNGHFIGREWLSDRWNEKNCRPQCKACNNWGQGEGAKFKKYLIGEYGVEYVDYRIAMKNKKRPSVFELKVQIEHYTKKVADLKKIKGIE